MRVYGATYLLQAEILDVDVASESRIEQQIPAGVVIVVVDVYAIAVPFPIAAVIEVVGGNHPVRIVVQHHAPRPVIDSPRDKLRFHVFVAAMRVRPARPNAVVFQCCGAKYFHGMPESSCTMALLWTSRKSRTAENSLRCIR